METNEATEVIERRLAYLQHETPCLSARVQAQIDVLQDVLAQLSKKTNALLPCPFCGGSAMKTPYAGGFRVHCQGCGISTTPRDMHHAAETWNGRTVRPATSHKSASVFISGMKSANGGTIRCPTCGGVVAIVAAAGNYPCERCGVLWQLSKNDD